MNPKLQTMLAQYEQGQARVQDILVESERTKGKWPAQAPAPAPAPAPAVVAPTHADEKPDAAKLKTKLKVSCRPHGLQHAAAMLHVPLPQSYTHA